MKLLIIKIFNLIIQTLLDIKISRYIIDNKITNQITRKSIFSFYTYMMKF